MTRNQGQGSLTAYIDITSTTGLTLNHNTDLIGLQGGSSGQYYHITHDEHAAVTGSTSPSSSNPFATLADIAASSGDTKDVKVSANDTTPGFLEDKLTGGTNVTLTTLNEGGNELLQINVVSTVDTYVTGFTYNNSNSLTISQNEGQPDLSVTINQVTGMTNTGNLDLQGELANSTGNIVINDNLDITGVTTSWGDILPGAHLTYDLGADGQRWDELWVRKVRVGTTTTTLEETGGNFEISGNTGDFNFRPASNVVSHADFNPGIDLGYNLGTVSDRWSTVYAGDISATGVTISGLGSGRVVYTNGSGGLTTEAGFEYNDITDTLTTNNLSVTNPSGTTSSIGDGGLVIGSGGAPGNNPGVGDLLVHGNLTVYGTETVVDTTNLYVEDNNITINYNPTGDTSATYQGAGFTVQDGDGAGTDIVLATGVLYLNGNINSNAEYTAATGASNLGFFTQMNDILIRNTNNSSGAPDGKRVLAEDDCLDGGTY